MKKQIRCFMDVPPGAVFLYKARWMIKLHSSALVSFEGMVPNFGAVLLNGEGISVPDGMAVRLGSILQAKTETA